MRHLTDEKLPLRDGTLLNYDLYQPDREGAYPAILMRTPYTKESLTREGIYASVERYTLHGYHVIVVECRGTGLSEGILNANAESEYEDGYDTVEWIAAQPWCDGSVGMFGLSYFGFTQLAAASLAPPSLKAICPFMTQDMEPFGSQMTQTFNYGHICWIYGQLTEHPQTFIKDPAERERLLPILREHAQRLNDYALFLPQNQNPAAMVKGAPLVQDYIDLVNGMENKAFWDSLRHPTDHSRMMAPMFHCTGWFDVTLNTTIHNWNAMLEESRPEVSAKARLLIGPWAHGGGFQSAFGRYDFGFENDGQGQDVNGQMLSWFDHHIKGKSNCVNSWPTVRYFVMGLNEWRGSSAWPPAEAVLTPYYLRAGRLLSTDAPATTEVPDTYVYDPANPPAAYAPAEDAFEQIPDYRPLTDRSDGVCYETPVLDAPLTIAGTLRMKLYAITDARDTDFTCRVVDVYPNGREFLLGQGLIRVKWRKGFFQYEPIIPGEPVEYEIESGNIACHLFKGHKLKVHISSALFPLYDRNLNTGESCATGITWVKANQTLLHDTAHPSCLLVPIVP